MKKRIHSLVLIAALMSAAATTAVVAKEEMATGSIRPSGKVESADLPALAKINLQQAIAAAVAKAPGSVIKAELEVEDGNLVYSFEIVGADRKTTEVEIDAGNGSVLGSEDEKNEKGEAHEERK